MEFNIKKNGTLPLLKMQVVDDGRGEFDSFMSFIEKRLKSTQMPKPNTTYIISSQKNTPTKLEDMRVSLF